MQFSRIKPSSSEGNPANRAQSRSVSLATPPSEASSSSPDGDKRAETSWSHTKSFRSVREAPLCATGDAKRLRLHKSGSTPSCLRPTGSSSAMTDRSWSASPSDSALASHTLIRAPRELESPPTFALPCVRYSVLRLLRWAFPAARLSLSGGGYIRCAAPGASPKFWPVSLAAIPCSPAPPKSPGHSPWTRLYLLSSRCFDPVALGLYSYEAQLLHPAE